MLKFSSRLFTALLISLAALATARADDQHFLPYGTEGLPIPPQPVQSGATPRDVELLTQALANDPLDLRVRHVADLGQCGPAALPALLNALNDPSPLVRAQAAAALGQIGDSHAASAVAAKTADSDPSVRREAVLAAAALGDADAASPALDDSAPDVRRAALQVASTPRQANRIAQLLPAMSLRQKLTALAALARIGDSHAIEAVLPCLAEAPPIHAAAITALGRMKATDHADAALHALTDADPGVRRAAMDALANLVSTDVRQSSAIHLLADPDPTVRLAAANALAAVPTPDAIAPLRGLLSDAYPPIHVAARDALAAVGPEVIPTAVALLDDPDALRRIDGSYILAAHRSTAGLQRHLALLQDSNWGVVEQAARAMVQIDPPAADAQAALFAGLKRALLTPTAAGTPTAALFLAEGRIRDKNVIPLALPQLPVHVPSMLPPDSQRTAAIWALGMTAAPASPAAGQLLDLHTQQLQSPQAIFESIKALVNMHDVAALPALQRLAADPRIAADNDCRWIVWYACQAMGAPQPPFVPRPALTDPQLSIEAIAPR